MKKSPKIQKETRQLMHSMQLPDTFENIVHTVYQSLIKLILDKKNDAPLLISINGAQGTGKSTLTLFIKHLIELNTDFHVANISLDDFYFTRLTREKLANDIHPLLITRGVPGTHDMEMIENCLDSLMNRHECTIPVFDKSIDDRLNNDKWVKYNNKNHPATEIILFEGWCNNSPYQTAEELIKPINELEENEDKDGSWRSYVNEQLKLYHKKIFNLSDISIMLKAPNFEKVYEWRKLQEEKLQNINKTKTDSRIMSSNDLNRFIQHFERITRNTLNKLPETADIVIPVLNDHSIKNIIKNENFK